MKRVLLPLTSQFGKIPLLKKKKRSNYINSYQNGLISIRGFVTVTEQKRHIVVRFLLKYFNSSTLI